MQHFRPSRLFTILILIMSLATVVSGQQAEDAQDDPEDGGRGYTGTWSLVIGPSRLVWELEADSYEFYAYQAETIRIGSRGELSVEEDVITFLSRETTDDGEEWEEVELPEEEASRSFAYSVEERRGTDDENGDVELLLRLAVEGRPQFFTDYREGAGEPQEGDNGEDAENGAAGNADDGAAVPDGDHQGD
ncbi:MAG: hypothetical protein ACLFPO_08905 [Spirochaetaceae bacterium]